MQNSSAYKGSSIQAGVSIGQGKAVSMYDYETGKVLHGNAQQMNFVDKSPYTNPELFKINQQERSNNEKNTKGNRKE